MKQNKLENFDVEKNYNSYMNSSLSQKDIAILNNVSASAVNKLFQKYELENNINLKKFKENKANCLLNLQKKSYDNLLARDFEQEKMRDVTLLLAIAHDKHREMTENNRGSGVNIIFSIVNELNGVDLSPRVEPKEKLSLSASEEMLSGYDEVEEWKNWS